MGGWPQTAEPAEVSTPDLSVTAVGRYQHGPSRFSRQKN